MMLMRLWCVLASAALLLTASIVWLHRGTCSAVAPMVLALGLWLLLGFVERDDQTGCWIGESGQIVSLFDDESCP
jgi:hypothetical protein